jgi:hypothetical protein
MGDAAPSSRREDVFSSPYCEYSSSRASESSATEGSDLENCPLDSRRLVVPDIGSTALRCRSTDYRSQGME